jgi:hypothetical protein
MNILNDDVLNKIYFMKHNLEFRECINELLNAKLHTKFGLNYLQSLKMFYFNHNKVKTLCVNVHNIDCTYKELLLFIINNKMFS